MRLLLLIGDIVTHSIEENGTASGGNCHSEDLHVAEARVDVEREEGTHEDADHSVESRDS